MDWTGETVGSILDGQTTNSPPVVETEETIEQLKFYLDSVDNLIASSREQYAEKLDKLTGGYVPSFHRALMIAYKSGYEQKDPNVITMIQAMIDGLPNGGHTWMTVYSFFRYLFLEKRDS